MFNLVAIHAISLTTTEAILDICSSPPSENVIDLLREECTNILASKNGFWSKDGVSQLCRMDSTIRESLRFSNFGLIALSRRVSPMAYIATFALLTIQTSIDNVFLGHEPGRNTPGRKYTCAHR